MTPSALTKLGLKQIRANRKRLGLTLSAVVLSVAFMTAAIVLGGGYSAVIYGWGEGQSVGVDLIVEPELPFQALNFEVNPARIDDETLALVRDTPGVADARPMLWTDNRIRPELPGGGLVPDRFATTTRGWVDGGPLEIVEGAPPATGHFTLDYETAADNGYAIGTTYGVTTPSGTRDMVLSGFTDFRETDSGDKAGTTAGQVLMTFDLVELQAALGEQGYVRLDVNTAPGISVDDVRTRLETRVPDGVDILTQAEFQERLRAQVSPFANGFRYGLVGFAVLSVLVSAFIIFNTFTMLMSQRTREIGLLRAVGASPKQIRSSVRNEAGILGAIASVAGIGVGLLLSHALSALLRASSGLPDPDLSLTPAIAMGGLAVGTGTTVLAAAAPARRASGIPVMAALISGLATSRPTTNNKRFTAGAVISVVGTGVVGLGAAGTGSTPVSLLLLLVGAIVVSVGIALLNPLWLTPLSNLLGWPLARFAGVPGRLAGQNISRDSRRSASTAGSLMVGLALVSLVLVVGQSAKDRVASGAATAYDGDYIIANQNDYKYPIAASEALRQLDEVAATTAISFDPASVNGKPQYITVADTAELGGLVDFGGSFAMPSVGIPVWVTETEASARNLSVGDPVTIEFFNGTEVSSRVAGTYANNAAGRGNYLIDRSTWVEYTGQTTVDVIVIQSEPGASEAAFRAAMDRFEAANEQLSVRSIDAYVQTADDNINQTLGIVNILMGLTILISFLGIANTIALATFERSTEIGLLKAVGMKQRQVRRMIRYEAALISLFGASIGAAIGVAFGAAAVSAFPASDKISVPGDQIAVLVVLSAIAGVLAAAVPAWRTARTPALDLLR